MKRKRISAKFYKSKNGNEPVREWLLSLTKAERKKIGEAIKTAELGWPIGMPTCKNLKNGLFEIRVSVSKKWARIFFYVKDSVMVLLHAIMKKSNSTPQGALKTALDRKKKHDG